MMASETFQEMIHILRHAGYSFYSLNGDEILLSAQEIEDSIPFGVLKYVIASKAECHVTYGYWNVLKECVST